MAPPPAPAGPGLELPGDREDRPWELKAQRWGWVAFAALVLAGALGLLGHGPLSRARAGGPDGLVSVDYHRFERQQAPTELVLSVKPAAVRDGRLKVAIDRAFLDGVEVRQVQPPPIAVELHADRQVYVFDAPSLHAEATVRVHYEPAIRLAFLSARIGIEGGDAVAFRQFVYP